MNIKEIKEMINLMNENGLAELEIEKDGMRIRLKKHPPVRKYSAGLLPRKEKDPPSQRGRNRWNPGPKPLKKRWKSGRPW
jgi:hypothetical protein